MIRSEMDLDFSHQRLGGPEARIGGGFPRSHASGWHSQCVVSEQNGGTSTGLAVTTADRIA